MDCLRTFNFTAGAQSNFTGTQIATWGVAPQNYWQAEIGITTVSTFNIQGYKNINVYRIDVVGRVASIIQEPLRKAIVNDWTFLVRVNGQNSQIGGTITTSPNPFVIQDLSINPTFLLGKYNSSIQLESPVASVTSIEIVGLQVSGIGAQDLTSINVGWGATFVVHYNFEGE